MIDSIAFYGNFAIGQSRTILDTFKFKVADSIPAWYNTQFLAIAEIKTIAFGLRHSQLWHMHCGYIISTSVSDPPPEEMEMAGSIPEKQPQLTL